MWRSTITSNRIEENIFIVALWHTHLNSTCVYKRLRMNNNDNIVDSHGLHVIHFIDIIVHPKDPRYHMCLRALKNHGTEAIIDEAQSYVVSLWRILFTNQNIYIMN